MKSSKTSFLRNCISGWNVRIELKRIAIPLATKFLPIFAGTLRLVALDTSMCTS